MAQETDRYNQRFKVIRTKTNLEKRKITGIKALPQK
jgi:hypothetical protein